MVFTRSVVVPVQVSVPFFSSIFLPTIESSPRSSLRPTLPPLPSYPLPIWSLITPP
jgi:hypothetical protein